SPVRDDAALGRRDARRRAGAARDGGGAEPDRAGRAGGGRGGVRRRRGAARVGGRSAGGGGGGGLGAWGCARAGSARARARGARGEELPDGLIVRGGKLRGGATIDSALDHRIALAFSVAALACEEPVEILGAEWADVSFPGFFELLTRLGAQVELSS